MLLLSEKEVKELLKQIKKDRKAGKKKWKSLNAN
jgi:hypothetical protein